MSVFRYEAVSAAGAVRQGVLHADSSRQCRAQLRAQGLTPIAVEEIGGEPLKEGGARAVRMPARQLAWITRQLALLLESAFTVERALESLLDQTEHAGAKEILAQVRGALLEGQPLHRALARFPHCFPDIYRALVAAGEESGELPAVMERLADYLETRQALRQQMMSAFLYPAILTVVAISAVVLVLLVVVPQVARAFEQANQQLPWVTRALIGTSELLAAHGWYAVPVLALLAWGLRRRWRVPEVRARWDGRLLKLPWLGRLLLSADMARLTTTLAILLSSAVPMVRALHASRAALASVTLRTAFDRVIQAVREGVGLSRALAAQGVFPKMLVQLVANGEATGKLGLMLQRAARQQQAELQRRSALLATLLEPLLILVMGAVVLFIVLAIFLPIIEANSLVK